MFLVLNILRHDSWQAIRALPKPTLEEPPKAEKSNDLWGFP